MASSTEPIRFAPVAEKQKTVWRRPKSFAIVGDISQIPLSSSELLLTSHHLPIAIDYMNDQPRVVAITNARFQRVPVVGPKGQWVKGYMPIALRCLPFRSTPKPGQEPIFEIALNLAEADEPGTPIFAADGTLTAATKQIAARLQRMEEGKLELQQAAEKLLIADVLTPFQMTKLAAARVAHPRSLTVDRNKFASLSNSRAAHLVRDGFLPIDLAAACMFSQRLLPTLVSVDTGGAPADDRERKIHTGFDELATTFGLDVQVDDSELFSIEKFERVSRRHEQKR
jgi:hypothetical protein